MGGGGDRLHPDFDSGHVAVRSGRSGDRKADYLPELVDSGDIERSPFHYGRQEKPSVFGQLLKKYIFKPLLKQIDG